MSRQQNSTSNGTTGPLAGLRVVEFASAGPGPFCCMLLGDMGAEVITVERPRFEGEPANPNVAGRALDPTMRNRYSVGLDLKQPGSVDVALRILESADVMTEGLRPGVMERLGLGPDAVQAHNPRLVYARITGWGQDGPMAQSAGHDINYIALTGALDAIGSKGGPPVPPLNLVGDYGGGGMLLAFGILAALFERNESGQGQVLDAAMVDGASLLMSIFHGMYANGSWLEQRGSNMLDSGAPFYGTYETADGRYMAVGAIEHKFYLNLLSGLGIEGLGEPGAQHDRSTWDQTRALVAAAFRTRTQAEWTQHFEGIDACVSPVLTISETYSHPHSTARAAFLPTEGGRQPAVAPRFSRSVPGTPRPPRNAGDDTEHVLNRCGFSSQEIVGLRSRGILL